MAAPDKVILSPNDMAWGLIPPAYMSQIKSCIAETANRGGCEPGECRVEATFRYGKLTMIHVKPKIRPGLLTRLLKSFGRRERT